VGGPWKQNGGMAKIKQSRSHGTVKIYEDLDSNRLLKRNLAVGVGKEKRKTEKETMDSNQAWKGREEWKMSGERTWSKGPSERV